MFKNLFFQIYIYTQYYFYNIHSTIHTYFQFESYYYSYTYSYVKNIDRYISKYRKVSIYKKQVYIYIRNFMREY